jgi:hypothetical protein
VANRQITSCSADNFREPPYLRLYAVSRTTNADGGERLGVASKNGSRNTPDSLAPFASIDSKAIAANFGCILQGSLRSDASCIGKAYRRRTNPGYLAFISPSQQGLAGGGGIGRRMPPDRRVGAYGMRSFNLLYVYSLSSFINRIERCFRCLLG